MIIQAKVVTGSGDGKKLGFPTANLELKEPLEIEHGVYAAIVKINGEEKKHLAAVHYGPRKVFAETNPLLEVHILDFSEDIYGKQLTVELKQFVRPTENFASLELLKEQMRKDCAKARELLQYKKQLP